MALGILKLVVFSPGDRLRGICPMVQAPIQTITLEEFLTLPATEPESEYIDGQIIQKPMPKGKHSRLQQKLIIQMNDKLESESIALALPELRCTFGGRSIVPDVAVFPWNRVPIDADGELADVFEGAPDWMLEILSPDQSQTKVINKILHALNHGTQMGWLLDPGERMIFVYPASQHPQSIDDPEQVIPVPEFAASMCLTPREVWGWLAWKNVNHS